MVRKAIVILIIVVAAVVGAGIGVLSWWLLREDEVENVTVIELDGTGFGHLPYKAAFTSIPKVGNIFWLFHPTTASLPTSKPILLWLDGVFEAPPSLIANFGMFGPYDINMNTREDSWVKDFNLLFVDGVLGTGFSTASDTLPKEVTLEQNADYLIHTLTTFYALHEDYSETPLYIVGHGHGAQLALSLAKALHKNDSKSSLKGIIIGNGIVAPALVLTELGNYLEQWSYVDSKGREVIESLSKECNDLVNQEKNEEARDKFLDLGKVINEEAGALAINLGHIVEKLTNETKDYFGYKSELRFAFSDVDTTKFMNEVVAPALGVPKPDYDSKRDNAVKLFPTVMKSSVDTVEYLLQNTDLIITIYNGNLDAVTNTPGQLSWVNNLQWSGKDEFKNSVRQPFVSSNLLQGYYKQTDRLAFYWVNAAGSLAPLDNPAMIRRIIEKTTEMKTQ